MTAGTNLVKENYLKQTLPRPNLFDSCQPDDTRFRKLMEKPEAEEDLAIYFTPRSGSSWLTQAIQIAGGLGRAGEFFNPNFVPRIAQKMGVASLDNYISGVRRKLNSGGVFSFEVTYYQMKRTFGDEDTFSSYFNTAPAVWLIRKDIVSQAVSLAKKEKTRIGHSNQLKESSAEELDSVFEYDSDLINRWLKHIINAEIKTERFFDKFDINPLRLSYEFIMAEGAERTLNRISRHIGKEDANVPAAARLPEKLGTHQNEAYAERFRKDAADHIDKLMEIRRHWVEAIPE